MLHELSPPKSEPEYFMGILGCMDCTTGGWTVTSRAGAASVGPPRPTDAAKFPRTSRHLDDEMRVGDDDGSEVRADDVRERAVR